MLQESPPPQPKPSQWQEPEPQSHRHRVFELRSAILHCVPAPAVSRIYSIYYIVHSVYTHMLYLSLHCTRPLNCRRCPPPLFDRTTHRIGLPMVVCVECLPADRPWTWKWNVGLPQVSTLAARVGTYAPPSLCRFATQGLLPLRWRWDAASPWPVCVWLCEDL